MKCLAVIDKEGKFVTMAYSQQLESEAEDGLVTRGGPLTEAGQTVIERYMPDKCSEMPVSEVIEQLQTDLRERGISQTKS